MNRPHHAILFSILLVLSAIPGAQAATNYVNLNNATPAAPYTSWAIAATNIQDAIDAASAGDVVLVADGVYQTGGRVVYGTLTNRVAVTKPLTLLSVNGPSLTTIAGYQMPGTTNGDAAVRCVYLTNGAVISGFTLTNGATRKLGDSVQEQSGGGVLCESTAAVVTNCLVVRNSAYYNGGGVYSGTLNGCILSTNTTGGRGGGAVLSILNNSTVVGNFAWAGGGSAFGTLNNCSVNGNSASFGGGSYSNLMNNCTLTANSSTTYGGGAHYGTLNNCIVSSNYSSYGGGANTVTLNNCAVFGNSAMSSGGVHFSTLNNCTVVGNSSPTFGGVSSSKLTNCIVYYNISPVIYYNISPASSPNYDRLTTLDYCCTTPLPTNGVNNITAEPQLASPTHLSPTSPCVGAGSFALTQGVDIDGEAWLNPPSIGCDQYLSGSVTGMLSVALSASYTNVTVGTIVDFTGAIEGKPGGSTWDFGDGTVVTNLPSISHAWNAPGDYQVVLRAWNETYPAGITATVTVHVETQSTHYVSLESTTPSAPYNSWSTAATNIQDAIDAALPGALVLVSNGVYQTGGRVAAGMLTNRVAVTKPLTLQSLNGPALTTIMGYQVPTNSVNSNAVRCVFLTDQTILSGFTLSNGASGWWNSTYPDDSAGGVWCTTTNAVVTNCVMVGNVAAGSGGGAAAGTLINCTISNNQAGFGGGAYHSTLINCTITSNYCSSAGGGVYYGTLNNCLLKGNIAKSYSGGAASSTLNNCLVVGNSAPTAGGTGNGTLNNCTVVGNTATSTQDGGGGGGYASTFNNCIVYYNYGVSNANYTPTSKLNYSCSAPLPANGVGNITAPPQLASFSHLSPTSPCRGSGSPLYSTGMDIDGSPWLNPPSMGCDEYYAGTVAGALGVAMVPGATNFTVGVNIKFSAVIDGPATGSSWDFGDGTIVSNQLVVTHAWTTPGDYQVTLRAWNDSNPAGVTATVTVHVVPQVTHYVSLTSTTPVAPYTSWATAATNIQHAIDAAAAGDLVLVSNGVYNVGGRRMPNSHPTNRVVLDKPLMLHSVNGPEVTIIQGYPMPNFTNYPISAIRCVYLANDTLLSGFTLANGRTYDDGHMYFGESGGGVWCESSSSVLSNCVVTGSWARRYGGGAYGGTLINCKLYNNKTLSVYGGSGGGGASFSMLINCTLSGNSSGVFGGELYNCITYGNTNYNYSTNSLLNYSCTTPLPTNGIGNFTNSPMFVNQAAGDLRLQSSSPCINAGNNSSVQAPTDLAGNPRIIGGNVDVGAYEFQSVMRFVNLNNPHPTAPYTSWATAATNIQDAIDIATDGELILVADGVYQTGGRVATGTITNRVAVTKPLTLLSVNGPAATAIVGYQVPPNAVSSNAVRCVYLTNGAVLSGFTVTNGASGPWAGPADDQRGGGVLCASTNAIMTNCVVVSNRASVVGGGAYSGTLIKCTLSQNRAYAGGGAYGSTLNNSLIVTNYASGPGGGAQGGTFYNCTLQGNSAGSGGGADSSTLNNCLIQGNKAIEAGGVFGSTLNNCAVIGNTVTATQDLAGTGGGGRSSTFNNCTVIGNTATPSKYGSIGGGGYACTFNNSIVYYNSASSNANYALCTVNYSCTTPLPSNGLGNISVLPLLASSFHLSPNSPCLGAGSPLYTQGVDIDGSPWLNPPSMGCDEYYAGTVTGALTVAQITATTNVTVNVTIKFTAQIDGPATGSSWDFGDGTVVSNQLVTTHVWTTPGDYLVTLKAWNDSNPAGVTSTVSVHVAPQITHYVSLTSTTPTAPYTSWATAATNIQHAIDAAAAGDLILVSNGVYNVGSRPSPISYAMNRVLVNKPLTLRSVNGPEVTVIQGFPVPVLTNQTYYIPDLVRCVYLANDTLLSGFTLANGRTMADDPKSFFGEAGGGVWCESSSSVLSNCVVTGNWARRYGAGAYSGTLINCKLYNNVAYMGGGGGTYYSTLINCTLTGNSGGGVFGGTLYNCIVSGNLGTSNPNYRSNAILNFCCTSPLPTNGVGNFTNSPVFVDQATGDLRLQFNSPCINAGNNSYVTSSVDLNGSPRIVGGTVDVGAYEFQSPSLVPFYAWLQQHGLSTDGSADTADSDGDGMNNWQEWLAGTSPTDAASSLQVLNPTLNGSNVTITWTSVTNRSYYVERVNALGAATPFQLLQANITGLQGTTSYTDTNAPASGPIFYRVGVE